MLEDMAIALSKSDVNAYRNDQYIDLPKMRTDRWMDSFSALYSRDSVIIAEIMPIATALIFYS